MSEHLIALSPAEVPIAQTNLVGWCQRKIIDLGRELRSARQNLTIAKDAGWKRTQWVGLINRTRQRMIYFAKIKTAVQAGYLVVPNFDVEVMAVRVDRAKPPENARRGLGTKACPPRSAAHSHSSCRPVRAATSTMVSRIATRPTP